MTRVMTRARPPSDARLLDDDLWGSPARLTETDLFTHAGPGWRRRPRPLDDPEDDR
ncbi:MAG: hypothetical protein ACXW3O_01060 [Brevundimonas sp.]